MCVEVESRGDGRGEVVVEGVEEKEQEDETEIKEEGG